VRQAPSNHILVLRYHYFHLSPFLLMRGQN
jgi:hypothetical protein